MDEEKANESRRLTTARQPPRLNRLLKSIYADSTEVSV